MPPKKGKRVSIPEFAAMPRVERVSASSLPHRRAPSSGVAGAGWPLCLPEPEGPSVIPSSAYMAEKAWNKTVTACTRSPRTLGRQWPYLRFGNDVRGEFDNREIPLADGPLDFVVAHSGRGGPGGRSVAGTGDAPGGRAGAGGGRLGSVLGGHARVGRSGRVRDPGRSGPSSTSA